MTTSIGTLVEADQGRTLNYITLRLAEINSPDFRQSVATGGSSTTLTDTVGLLQPDNHWIGGTVWILSGTYIGHVRKITDSALTGSISFATAGGTIVAGVDYAVCGPDAPYTMLKMAVNQALRELYVEKVDKTTVGVYGKYVYALPADITRVTAVELYRAIAGEEIEYTNTHWEETNEGELKFDRGFGPQDDDEIWIHYLDTHPELRDYDDDVEDMVDEMVNMDVLISKGTEKLLRLLYHRFGGDQKQLPEWLADAIEANKNVKRITRNKTRVILHTSGW
jgi:hypothetical protein